MARGQEAKNAITQKILDTFEGAFINEKEIRIPYMEAGELVQVKVTLTAAKTNVGEAMENTAEVASNDSEPVSSNPTQEEIDNVRMLIESLGM